MKKYIEKLHFITHDDPNFSQVDQVQRACEAGAKWIQYRCLTKSDEALIKEINAIAEICDDWGTTLIVTDHIHLHGKADIQGFHLEDMEADFKSIREKVGDDVTLGGSANTLSQLLLLAKSGADYAGFGPYSISVTKPNAYPLISPETYMEAVKILQAAGYDFPVLAVGGIKIYDIEALMQTGIYGIAASEAIRSADDFEQAYQDFYELIR